MTQMSPSISVVITCFNYAQFISQAIDSVLSQEDVSVELVVVDDASTDNSVSVISAYQDRLTPVFKKLNAGHGAAFNSGFEASSAQLVMFLDADDYLLPGALARVVKNFHDDTSMCQYRMNLVDAEGKAFGVFPRPEQPFLTGDQVERVLRIGRIPTTVTSGLVFSRRFLEEVMPMPPEEFRQGADGYLATLAPLYGHVQDGGSEAIAAYRQHGNNHSGFEAMIEKRSLWCVQHLDARYSALRNYAEKHKLTLESRLGWQDENYLAHKMALKLHGIDGSADTSRRQLSTAARKAVDDLPLSKSHRRLLSLWWIALEILPRSLAKHLHAWRLYAHTRPKWFKSSARLLRRI